MSSKDLLIFSAGAIAGAVASYFITKKLVGKRLWAEYQSIISKEDDEDEYNEALAVITSAANEISDRVHEKAADKPSNVTKYVPKVSSQDLLAERQEAVTVVQKAEYVPYTPPKASSIVAPYIISEEEYCSVNHQSNAMITWYSINQMGFDEGMFEVTDIDEVIGMMNIMEIEDSGASVGYVRNENNHTDYEIHVNRQENAVEAAGWSP